MLKALCFAGLFLPLCSDVLEAANIPLPEVTACIPGKPPKETVESCTKIMSLPDLDPVARRNAFLIRGTAYYLLNELGLAAADLRSAQNIEATSEVSLSLASLYINAGKSEDAIREFSKVIDAGKATAQIFNGRGAALENAGRYDEAIRDFNEALTLDPNLLMVVNNRAAAYAKQGNYPAAVKDIDAVLAKDPDMPVALLNRCMFQERAGQLALGLVSCERAEHLDPDNSFLVMGIGFVYYEAAHFEKAIEYFNKSLRLVPNDAKALYARGKAKVRLGNSFEGDADVVAAERIQSDVGAFLATSGFKP